MTGVTILNEFECLGSTIFVLPLGIGLIFVVLSFMASFDNELAESFACGVMAGLFLFCTYCIYWNSKVTRYDALVAPTVPATELMEHYEIVERKGDIWVLEPLKQEEEQDEL